MERHFLYLIAYIQVCFHILDKVNKCIYFFLGSEFSRLRSLRDPLKKMSKSDPDPKSRISLNDSPEDILKKIKKSLTDFTSEVGTSLLISLMDKSCIRFFVF